MKFQSLCMKNIIEKIKLFSSKFDKLIHKFYLKFIITYRIFTNSIAFDLLYSIRSITQCLNFTYYFQVFNTISTPHMSKPSNQAHGYITKLVPPLPQRIPITYLWFGKEVPEDYLISLAQLDYPVQFLKNPHISKNFTREILDIQKSDYYRLQHLYDYGGIYSDFDNIIDYDCLMKLLDPYRTQNKLVFMTNSGHNRRKNKEMTNNLIFAPYPGMPILKKMLDGVDERQGKIWEFAGLRYVAKFKQPLEVNMDKCVKHTGDWSWFDASNQVLKKKTAPHSRYSQKLLKKKDIVNQNTKLSTELKEAKQSKNRMQKQVQRMRQWTIKLKQQLKKASTDDSKRVIEELKNYQEHRIDSKWSTLMNGQASPADTIEDIQWQRESYIIKGHLQGLMERNQKLEKEKDVMMVMCGGSMVIILLLIVMSGLLIRKMKMVKNGDFKPVVETSRTVSEEN